MPPLQKGEFAVVQIKKGDASYNYKLNKKDTFPNPFGNGKVDIYLAVNRKGSYQIIEHKQVTMKANEKTQALQRTVLTPGIKAPHLKYTLDTKFIGWKKWNSDEKVRKVHEYVTKNFSYDYARENNQGAWYVPDYSRFMKNRMGTCYDMASLSGSLLREMGVPTRLVMGYPKNYGYHAWNEVYVNGKWLVIDTTFDLQQRVKTPYKKATDYKVSYRF